MCWASSGGHRLCMASGSPGQPSAPPPFQALHPSLLSSEEGSFPTSNLQLRFRPRSLAPPSALSMRPFLCVSVPCTLPAGRDPPPGEATARVRAGSHCRTLLAEDRPAAVLSLEAPVSPRSQRRARSRCPSGLPRRSGLARGCGKCSRLSPKSDASSP